MTGGERLYIIQNESFNFMLRIVFLFQILAVFPFQAAIGAERQYGDLIIDLKTAKMVNKSIMLPASNPQQSSFFIAVYCPTRLFNITDPINDQNAKNAKWEGWRNPTNTYRKRLVADICNQI
tara:strand:- start:33 stop:398 length:366 start_codon:yes stop_codon:yes gene_type:complete